ncbi:hypothetical protein AXF42_Ash005800 [Apostasia shenzhenica]|uniref:Uncharacterized protein n=1 Tax=Apostasia shenzhenica TaxID=1088818 RepID=A0A2I0BCF5_9ASPA|nr:hypothetical protein AXF42_Ash005800 [Apostasia shenzhenica]
MCGTYAACARSSMELTVILRIDSGRWCWLGSCGTNPPLFHGRRVYFSKLSGEEMLLLMGPLRHSSVHAVIPSSADHHGQCLVAPMFPLLLLLDSDAVRWTSLSVFQQHKLAGSGN